jgi:sphingomyelin phosphodiesterase 2
VKVLLHPQAGAEGWLRHSHHWLGGAIGSGLLLLSAHPIVDAAFKPFSARGDPAAVLQGDFFAGKGVGWAAVAAPQGMLSIFNVRLPWGLHGAWCWEELLVWGLAAAG